MNELNAFYNHKTKHFTDESKTGETSVAVKMADEVLKIFNEIDSDGDGLIKRNEVKAAREDRQLMTSNMVALSYLDSRFNRLNQLTNKPHEVQGVSRNDLYALKIAGSRGTGFLSAALNVGLNFKVFWPQLTLCSEGLALMTMMGGSGLQKYLLALTATEAVLVSASGLLDYYVYRNHRLNYLVKDNRGF